MVVFTPSTAWKYVYICVVCVVGRCRSVVVFITPFCTHYDTNYM